VSRRLLGEEETHAIEHLLREHVDLARQAEARKCDGEVLALLPVVDALVRLLEREVRERSGQLLRDRRPEEVQHTARRVRAGHARKMREFGGR
jgi:hypothetical protein